MNVEYKISGQAEYRPSVSSILALLNKPALLIWANKKGLAGEKIGMVRERSQKDGTELHSQVEEWLKNKTPLKDAAQHKACESFFADKEIIAIEKSISTEHFVGRIDLKWKHNGKVVICDMKSNKRKIYLENILQLVAYKMADGADSLCVLSIPEFKLLPVTVIDTTPFEEMIICLSKVCKLKKRLGFE